MIQACKLTLRCLDIVRELCRIARVMELCLYESLSAFEWLAILQNAATISALPSQDNFSSVEV